MPRSKEVGDTEFPDNLAWIRTYVVKDEDGTLGSVCIYQATDIETVRDHAERVGMPADEVTEIADHRDRQARSGGSAGSLTT